MPEPTTATSAQSTALDIDRDFVAVASQLAGREAAPAPRADRPKERAEIKKKAQRKLWNRTDEVWVVLKTSAAASSSAAPIATAGAAKRTKEQGPRRRRRRLQAKKSGQ